MMYLYALLERMRLGRVHSSLNTCSTHTGEILFFSRVEFGESLPAVGVPESMNKEGHSSIIMPQHFRILSAHGVNDVDFATLLKKAIFAP
jgi:hypothetical protein